MNCCSSCTVTRYCLKGVLYQQPTEESENFLIESFRIFRKCSNMLFEVASEKKIKIFICEFEMITSEKGEAYASVFLGFLPNNYRAEAAKRKKAITVIAGVSSACALSADATCAVATILLRCIPSVEVLSAITSVSITFIEQCRCGYCEMAPGAAEACTVRPLCVLSGLSVGAGLKLCSKAV
ncbi:uncharacterized protein MONOS_5866 [Monocercomonoides exilis]|uniref:uncharacterized protein n=1 Tax=Monocercomonoides exilis TaxID=2049356 RepID=UPI00355ABAB4|nr:hypothetical protein MONOS_5866 [Monocercomonoides exilis]|eukprot:MONOS_5866.1-p1 / transcript=MONOS_5866.1 / gene=MONOS_5866 / organism=Monocercomonoides_exilis_PA203 / gene_product=unspecified product / transcript_product=unspecified product / location=Mono_scaffold00176:62392-63105(-) / protein_length=182 / sequence_SO=supercontig / SO=protein_coding / is_pseudo=false